MTTEPTFNERLGVPLRWWVQGTMLVATMWLALVVAVPGLVAWGVTAVLLALLAALLTSYGSPRIMVADGVLHVGRARIAAEHIGGAVALDAEQTRRKAGVEADARAYLVLRPYLKRTVVIEITDRADPAPYWLVSTRHPEALAGAIGSLTRTG